jgi:dimethylhistidine N-methyltransferase
MSSTALIQVADHTSELSFREDVLDGLTQSQKTIPCKYLYDVRGSELFEQICELEEYYPTRTELAIMQTHGPDMAECLGPQCLLVEYGSGSSRKTRILLDHLERPAAYVPIDISRSALEASTVELTKTYPSLEILPVCADYTQGFRLPGCRERFTKRAVYFPGSTIGNFAPWEAHGVLKAIRELVGPGGAFLAGVDLKKDPEVLEAAYNDRDGVTAEFNLNVLTRMNRELQANFEPKNFRHHAFYNEPLGRIEMHLVSEVEQTAAVENLEIQFAAGETIHTENSYKYDPEDFAALAGKLGFVVSEVWTDPARLFSVQYLTPA